jgi:hypothetical protein
MKKVLLAYETALEAVRGMDFREAMDYLKNNRLEYGICAYCSCNGIAFHEMETYIFKTPRFDCTTTAEIIKTLEFRINYLKENHENTF